MKTVAFTTLGCRVNQYDTDAMKGLFIKAGYTPVGFDEDGREKITPINPTSKAP